MRISWQVILVPLGKMAVLISIGADPISRETVTRMRMDLRRGNGMGQRGAATEAEEEMCKGNGPATSGW